MTITLHHLGLSQSERIIWLLEAMRVPYELKLHKRDPVTVLAPEEIKKINPAGTAPVLLDDKPPAGTRSPVLLGETEAIVQYLVEVYGDDAKGKGSRFVRKPGDADYADYLSWYSYANGSLQPAMGRYMVLGLLQLNEEEYPMYKRFLARSVDNLALLDKRLGETGAFLVGKDITVADMMTVFSLTTMRGFWPMDLSKFSNILRYLKDISQDETYRKALEKGDPGLVPMIDGKVKQFDFKAFPRQKM